VPEPELISSLAREIALVQNATDAFDEAVAERWGLNRTDLRCQGLLLVHGEMSAGQLAEASGLTPGAVTKVVDRLARAGLVVRVADELDRRRITIRPTAQAGRFADEAYGPLAAEGAAELAEYPNDQLELILTFLQRYRELQERHVERVRTQGRRVGGGES
jgi:DNA-binding MarR family transcriptional regulator